MIAQWQNSRKIHERILVAGKLVLDTPAQLGSGDAEGLVDLPLLLDPLEGRALLTGSSVAGALRNYMCQFNRKLAENLFGNDIDGSRQSLLFVDDSIGEKPLVELRDGVAIDFRTGTAENEAKYDLELLTAGSAFNLSFELLVLKDREKEDHEEKLIEGLALVLRGLEKGEISLGARKSRGFGRCRVAEWELTRYDMTKPEGLLSWLDGDRSNCVRGANIEDLLGVRIKERYISERFTIEALFSIDSSLIIRSSGQIPEDGEARQEGICIPDVVHLHSRRGDNKDGKYIPIVSGTSLAGVLRSRAVRIANTLGKDGYSLADRIFGYRRKNAEDRLNPTASRLWVEETIVESPLSMVQSRIKIDRFTGGAYPGALFSEQPVFGKDGTRLLIRLSLEKPDDWEIGLLLLVLKDMWTGDLPLGGGSAVGRGRLRGDMAELVYGDKKWTIIQEAGVLGFKGESVDILETFVQALGVKECQG